MVPMTVPDHSPPGGGSVSENRSDPPTLAQVTAVIERLWPASLAESWDAVGPVVGRPDAPVRRILFAVDPVQAVADEAVELGADLLLTHHPLLLRGAPTVAAGGHSGAAKGAVVHTLIEHGIGLVAAHTNADSAVGGVSDAIARRLGVTGVRPLAPSVGGDGDTGIGRVGELESPVSLRGFAERVAALAAAQDEDLLLQVGVEQQAQRQVQAQAGRADLRGQRAADDHPVEPGCRMQGVEHLLTLRLVQQRQLGE